jgi:hypothetical protein
MDVVAHDCNPVRQVFDAGFEGQVVFILCFRARLASLTHEHDTHRTLLVIPACSDRNHTDT